MALRNNTDIMTVNDISLKDAGFSDIVSTAPAFNKMEIVKATHGSFHKWIVTTGEAGASFRTVNNGVDDSDEIETSRAIPLAIVEATAYTDKAEADASNVGRDVYQTKASNARMKTAIKNVDRQIFAGKTYGDSTGFSGLSDISYLTTATGGNVVDYGNSGAQVVYKPTGGTAGTASSIWFLHVGEDGVAPVMPSANLKVEETVETQIIGQNGKPLPGYMTPCTSFAGVQTGGLYDAARIQVSNDTGKKATRALLYQGLQACPECNMIVMHPRDLANIQADDTAHSPTGMQAELLTAFQTIDVIADRNLPTNEAILA